MIVADGFKRTSFLAHMSHRNSKLITCSAYLICINEGDKWVKFGLQTMKL